MENGFDIGDLVESLRGRDAGKVFCIVRLGEPGYVFLSDGKYRRLDHPKLKKTKHLKKIGVISQTIRIKFARDAVVFDGELNKAIRVALTENVDR